MAQRKGDHQKFYFNPIQKTEVVEVCKLAANKKIPIIVWSTGTNRNEAEKYSAESFDQSSRQLFLRPPEPSVLETVWTSRYLDREVFLKMSLDNIQYFSSSILHGHPTTQKYWIFVKNDVYRTQQRFNYRLAATPLFPIRVELKGRGEYPGIDISVGGVSFSISDKTSQFFTKGTIFEDCKLSLKGDKFHIPKVKVMGLWPWKDGLVQVGLAFNELSAGLEKALFRSITDGIRLTEGPANKGIVRKK